MYKRQFRDLDRLLSGREVHLDLIRVKADGKSYYAANICSMGLDARIGTQIDRYRRFPGLGGKGAYLASTVVNVLKGTRQPFTIDFGSRRVSGEKTLICICNGSWYGGSFHPVPDARADDGLLDVLTVDAVSLPRLATAIGAYKKGLYARFPGLIDHCRTDALTVTCPTPQVINLDGEAVTACRAVFTLLPHNLRFLAPAGVRLLSKERKGELLGAI